MLSLRDEQGQTQHYQAVLKAEDPEYQVPAEPGTRRSNTRVFSVGPGAYLGWY